MPELEDTALGRFRVLEFAGPMGEPCGRYLADLGADVIKVEPPGGDPARLLAPFAGERAHPERSIYFLHFNASKRGIVLDIAAPDGRATLLRLLRISDVLLESFPQGYLASLGLSYEDLAAVNPTLVMTSITPFGQTGPYRFFKGNNFVAEAVGGSSFLEGEPEGQPYARSHYQAYQMAGLHAAYGTLLALYERRRSGRGQHVDVSLQEVVAHQDFGLVNYSSHQEIHQRAGRASPWRGVNRYPSSDGWVHLSTSGPSTWERFVEWTRDPVLQDPKYQVDEAARKDVALLDERISTFTRQWTREDFLKEATRRRIPAAPVHSPSEFVDHPDTEERGFFVPVSHPVVGHYRAPGAPARFSRTPWRLWRPAPLLGEHAAEILALLVHKGANNPNGSAHQERKRGGLPLEGIRVVDLSRVWAGPYGTRFLADFGAEVIKVESGKFPDGRGADREVDPDSWRRGNTHYAEINRNKLSVTIDLHAETGRELVKRLVAISDIVVENYHASTLPRWGLGYEGLRAVKPDVIMISCPGYGDFPRTRDLFAYGSCLNSFVGMGYLWGFPDSPLDARSRWPFPDYVTAAYLPVVTMAALLHREETSEGQLIRLVQSEAAASMIGTAYLEYTINGVQPQPWGNRDPNAVPQGIYPCLGDDRWVAISCTSDEEWLALCRVIGQDDLGSDPRLATPEGRRAHHDEVDGAIAAWTRTQTTHQAMLRCQGAGVPSGVVASGEDLYRDPHLRARGYVVEIDHPAPGRLEHPGMTVRLTRTPGQVRRPAPRMGEHNDYVFQRLLGLTDAEQRELIEERVLV